MLTELLIAQAQNKLRDQRGEAHDTKALTTTPSMQKKIRDLENRLDAANTSTAALAHMARIFPGEKDRQRTTLAFAKDILSIEPSAGFEDDLALISILAGGVDIADNLKVFLGKLDGLTDEQRAEFDAIHSKHLDELADFAAQTMGLDIEGLFHRESLGRAISSSEPTLVSPSPTPSAALTNISGIGESTANRLAEHGVHNVHDLAILSNDRIDELDKSIIPKGVKKAKNWQKLAKTELGES